jgi:phospholipase/carboxylesterase
MRELEFDVYAPDGAEDGAPVVVLLHGRGASKEDLRVLRPHLPPGVVAVFPQAPFEAAPWGYGPGWAWYRYLGEDRPEPESFAASLDALEAWLAALPQALPVSPGPIALGGFSQGGTLSVAYALTHPGRIAAVLNFSGFLASHPRVRVAPDTVAGTRFFWGHGTRDPNIPFALAERGRALLLSAGAALEARDYPIGHWIDPAELQDAMRWLEAVLAGAAGGMRAG